MDDQLKYPWYQIVEGDQILQGDILLNCPILMPMSIEAEVTNDPIRATVSLYDVVVMSQSCDLEEGKIEAALVCPHWSLDDLSKKSDFFKSSKGKEETRRGNVPGYHLLNECAHPEATCGIRVVDLRSVFTVPIPVARSHAAGVGKRARLLPPYREHLSQAFARCFMRVGLPSSIARFK